MNKFSAYDPVLFSSKVACLGLYMVTWKKTTVLKYDVSLKIKKFDLFLFPSAPLSEKKPRHLFQIFKVSSMNFLKRSTLGINSAG